MTKFLVTGSCKSRISLGFCYQCHRLKLFFFSVHPYCAAWCETVVLLTDTDSSFTGVVFPKHQSWLLIWNFLPLWHPNEVSKALWEYNASLQDQCLNLQTQSYLILCQTQVKVHYQLPEISVFSFDKSSALSCSFIAQILFKIRSSGYSSAHAMMSRPPNHTRCSLFPSFTQEPSPSRHKDWLWLWRELYKK